MDPARLSHAQVQTRQRIVSIVVTLVQPEASMHHVHSARLHHTRNNNSILCMYIYIYTYTYIFIFIYIYKYKKIYMTNNSLRAATNNSNHKSTATQTGTLYRHNRPAKHTLCDGGDTLKESLESF